jgi:hypothetical protein
MAQYVERVFESLVQHWPQNGVITVGRRDLSIVADVGPEDAPRRHWGV